MEIKFTAEKIVIGIIVLCMLAIMALMALTSDAEIREQEQIKQWIQIQYNVDEIYWDSDEKEFYARTIKTSKLSEMKIRN